MTAHPGQQFLDERHLGTQLLRHPLAAGFVVGVFLMAEGGGMDVERCGDSVRLHVVPQLLQNVQKADQRVGVLAVLGGQQLDAVKRAVGDAVAVEQ